MAQKPPKKSLSPRAKIALALIALAAAGYGVFFHGNDKDANANKKPAVAIKTAPVARADVKLELQGVGTATAMETVALRARLDSQVTQVLFKDGDYVEKGALLFVLDDRALQAQLAEMQANLARDRAQAENLRQQYERVRTLNAKGYQSQASLDQARAAYQAQNATVGATLATMDNVKVQLDYTRITAPISGRTGTINVTVGNTVRASDAQPLVTINQVKPIRVQASWPQAHLAAVRDAMAAGPLTVIARREGATEPSTGTLSYIDNTVDQATGTFVSRAEFANEDEKLWPGMFLTLTLVLGEEKQVLTVPEESVQHGQEGDFVFVVAEGKAAKRPVTVSRMQDGLAVITSGAKEGEIVATDGLMSLKDGSAVVVSGEKKEERTSDRRKE